MIYTQCSLQKDNRSQVAWIPKKFATVDAILRIKQGEDWEDGWKVMKTHQTVEEPCHYTKAVRVHRKRTGDSEPKQTPQNQ